MKLGDEQETTGQGTTEEGIDTGERRLILRFSYLFIGSFDQSHARAAIILYLISRYPCYRGCIQAETEWREELMRAKSRFNEVCRTSSMTQDARYSFEDTTWLDTQTYRFSI